MTLGTVDAIDPVWRYPQRCRCGHRAQEWADAVALGTAALIALGDNDQHDREKDYQAASRMVLKAYDDWQGNDPAGITTQDRFDGTARSRRRGGGACATTKVMTIPAQTIARACGKSHLHTA